MSNTFPCLRVTKPPTKVDQRLLINDFQYFCEVIRHRTHFADSPYPDFIHGVMWEMQQTLCPDTYQAEVLIEMPRGHGKTTIIVAPFIAWRLLRDPSLRVAVFSAGKTRASIIATNAKKIITRIFPDMYSLAKKPTATTLHLHNRMALAHSDPSLTSFPIHGIGSVGGRADLLVPDDIYTSESADTEIKSQGVFERFEDLPNMYGENPMSQRITIGTRQGYNDLYDIIHRGEYGQFKILKFPVIRPEDEAKLPPPPIGDKEAVEIQRLCIWPRMMSLAKLKSSYNSPRVWNTQYMLRPPQSGCKAFLTEQVIFEQGTPNRNAFRRIAISIDPATGNLTRTVGDNLAIVVGGMDDKGHWHLINGWAKRNFDMKEVGQVWRSFVKRYSTVGETVITYVENHAQQSLMVPTLRQYLSEREARIHLSSTNAKKNYKIMGFITPVLTTNRLHVWPCDIRDVFVQQLDRFDPQADNNDDDIIDAFAMLLRNLYQFDRSLVEAAKEMRVG